ncbi:MAG: DNA mismatch repair protein MutS [Halanaeroarchaeum sp.]
MVTDAALGAPEKMLERRDELTPMMSQYVDLCERYDDSLVLFQVGDFYEAFCGAAEVVARRCEITLTKREDSTGRYRMAGVPIDNAESYVETLLDAGYRVAIADQVEDPDEVTGVVDRAVTRIVTPGTLTEDELLAGDANNYVACLVAGDRVADGDRAGEDDEWPGPYGLALLDVSTGDFVATSVDDLDAVEDEVSRFAPAEALVGPNLSSEVGTGSELAVFPTDCTITTYDRAVFELDAARERVSEYFGHPDSRLAGDAEIRAVGALLAYAEYARGGHDAPQDESTHDTAGDTHLDYLNHLVRYDPREYMLLDAVALESLELFERRTVHGAEDATLIDVLDETSCALGSRRLTDWLRRPLLDREAIAARHDAVEELVERVETRERLSDLLRDVYDVERLISRVSRGRANARDLRSLKDTLDVVPEVRAALDDAECDSLADLRDGLDELADARELIGEAIREDPPIEITDGGVVRPGYSDELDDLRETEREGKAWIDDLEERERERTGIDSLKVGYNQVHGYYIEVTDPNLDRVPDDYTRRQTLKNAERYYTPELKEREDEIVRAEGRADDLEYELFREVRGAVADEAERVQDLADGLARLDALVSLAAVAAKHDYVRPTFDGEGIRIEGGRHPVVERTQESFVPNDTELDDDAFFAIVTGPNMSGKSTYMRQVALICVLAQVGSFVPAASADLRIVDRVFTRVGASDDIAGGRSTFMVEMTELADILESATEDSLVLLDEVGRGTSTTDGLAIARAVTEHLHDEVGATTLFATHHHELTAAADRLEGVANYHFDATQTAEGVEFDHEIRPGAAKASYGIEVARTAGVPDAVVDRSRALLETEHVAGDEPDPATDSDQTPGTATDGGEGDGTKLADRNEREAAALEELQSLNVANTTPIEALQIHDELQGSLE